MAQEVMYAVNTKAQGKVHRVTFATARLPRNRQRVACGWPMKPSTSTVFYGRCIKWGAFCSRCFGREDTSAPAGEAVEIIEQFPCGAKTD